jgi:hypothetical protein
MIVEAASTAVVNLVSFFILVCSLKIGIVRIYPKPAFLLSLGRCRQIENVTTPMASTPAMPQA